MKKRHGSQVTLSMSSECKCVCKPRWGGDGEAHPAPNLMLSVPGAIEAILDIEVKGLARYTESERITNHQSPM